jgi:tetratricopeptide (TPR) repeat protein
MSALKALVTLVTIYCLSGCAGVGVFTTSDPRAKLSDAQYLFDHEGRPLIAERLIREAIDIFEKNGDDVGLGETYYTYGWFFVSPSIDKWEKVYRESGFLDKTATFDSRFSKADESFAKAADYFSKARGSLLQSSKYDMLANADRLRGIVYMRLKKRENACSAFDESLESYRLYVKTTQDAKLSLPKGYATYDDFIGSLKKSAGC